MRLKLSFLFLVLALSIATVSAISMETAITVNTAPHFNVTVSIKDASGYYHFETADTGKDGSAILLFSIDSLEYELVSIGIKQGPVPEPDYFVRFGDSYSSGESQEFDFYPKWYPKPNSTETTLTEENVTEELNETNSPVEEVTETPEEVVETIEANKTEHKLTAFSVSDGVLQINGRFLAYAFGIIVLAILVVMFIRWEKKKPKKEKKIKVTKLSDIQQKSNDEIKKQEDKIANAKKMIQEAQEELKKINDPNTNKIEQAKKKLIEDQKELMRLREEAKKNSEPENNEKAENKNE